MFENFYEFNQYLIGTDGILTEDQYTFLIISRSILLRMRNVSGIIIEKTKIHTL